MPICEDGESVQVHPSARLSTIKKRVKRCKSSSSKKKRRLSFERLPVIAKRFHLTMKPCIGGGGEYPEVCVIRGQRIVVSGHWTVVHVAFPINGDDHAFKTMSMIRMRQDLVAAHVHNRAFRLPSGAYCYNEGRSKLGSLALKALEQREALGVAVVISTWKNNQRIPYTSQSLRQAITDLLAAAGHTPGRAMSLYDWGKGCALDSENSANEHLDDPNITMEERRQKVLNAVEKRLLYHESRDSLEVEDALRSRRIIGQRKTTGRREKVQNSLSKRMVHQIPPDIVPLSACERSTKEDSCKLMEPMYDFEKSLAQACELESDEKNSRQDFENEVECIDLISAV